jgi:hypothetical protein
MKLTNRGRIVVNVFALTAMVAVMSIVGAIETAGI